MKIEDATELLELISEGKCNISSRKEELELRKKALSSITSNNGFEKMAFDTRRVDQKTDYNPRRGLQNYSRSQSFLYNTVASKVKNLSRLQEVMGELQSTYGKEPEWQDSNARVLLSSLEKGLRSVQKDGDFTEAQPGMGSLDYLEELLHVRYRLAPIDLATMAAKDIKKIILSKDEELINEKPTHSLDIKRGDVARENYDTLLNKLFDVNATATPGVERTITITIKDNFVGK